MSHNDNNQQQQPVGVPPRQGDLKKASPKPKRPGKAAPPRPRKAPVRCPSKKAPSQRFPPGRRNSDPSRSPSSGFLESCLAALCCCCLLDACL